MVQLNRFEQSEPLDLIWLAGFLKHFYESDLFGPSVDESCRAVIAENRRMLMQEMQPVHEVKSTATTKPIISDKIILQLDHQLRLEASQDYYAKPRTLTFVVRRHKNIKQGYLQLISGSTQTNKAASPKNQTKGLSERQTTKTADSDAPQHTITDNRKFANNKLSTTFLLEGLLGVSAKSGKAILERKIVLPAIKQPDDLTAHIIFHALLVSPVTELAKQAESAQRPGQTNNNRALFLEIIGNDLALQKLFLTSLLEKLLASTIISDSFTLLFQPAAVLIDRICLCADIERFLTRLDHLAKLNSTLIPHIPRQKDCWETKLAESKATLLALLQSLIKHAALEQDGRSDKSSPAAGLTGKARLTQLLAACLDADRTCQDMTTLLGILALMEKKQIACTPQLFQSLCSYLSLPIDSTQAVKLLSGQVTEAPVLPSLLLAHFVAFLADDGAFGAFHLKPCPPSLAAVWADYFFAEDHSLRHMLFRHDLADLPDLTETLLKKILPYAEPYRLSHLTSFVHPLNSRAIRIRSDKYRWTIAFDYRPLIRQGRIMTDTPEFGGVFFTLTPPLSAVNGADLRFRIASADLTEIKIEIKNAGRKCQFDHYVTLSTLPIEHTLALDSLPADISGAIEEIVFLITATEFADPAQLKGELILEDVRIC